MVVDVGFRHYTEQRFRLSGYNAPELRGPEKKLGKIAKEYLEDLCPPGTEVGIETFKADAFGRYLCDISTEDHWDLVTHLIEEGYGVAWDGKGKRPRFAPGKPYPNPLPDS